MEKMKGRFAALSPKLSALRSRIEMAPFEGRYQQGYFKIVRSLDSKVTFALVRRGYFARVVERFAPIVPLRTGEADFDRAFAIETPYREATRSLLMAKEVRDAVRAIFASGFGEIRCERGRLEATVAPFFGALPRSMTLPSIGEAIAHLDRIATRVLPTPERIDEIVSGARSQRRVKIANILAGAGILGGAAGGFYAAWFYPLLDSSPGPVFLITLEFTAVVFPLLVAGTWRWLELEGAQWRKLSEAYFGALVALFLVGICGALYLNGALDRSAPTPRRDRIIAKRIYETKSGTHCEVEIPGWNPSSARISLELDLSECPGIRPKSSIIEFVTHRGWLGWEWYDSVTIKD